MFIYAREKKLFDEEWKQLRALYREWDMTEEAIDKICAYDWEWFCSRRTYENRTQELPSEIVSEDSNISELFQKHKSLYNTFDESDFRGRFAWIDTIANPLLADKLKQLSEDDLELLTFLVIYGYSQAEIAHKQRCNQSVISRKFKRIKSFFESMS